VAEGGKARGRGESGVVAAAIGLLRSEARTWAAADAAGDAAAVEGAVDVGAAAEGAVDVEAAEKVGEEEGAGAGAGVLDKSGKRVRRG
jgi:hypothetical protein